MSDFPGVAFITGAGSSLGFSIASSLISGGCTRLALVDSSSETLSKTAARCLACSPEKAVAIEQIISEKGSETCTDAAITRAVARFDAIHYCINIPHLLPEFGASLDMSTDQWSEVLQENQRDTWLNIRGELRQLLSQQEDGSKHGKAGRSSIVNITSSHGLGAQPGFPVSAASSHAIVGMTRTVAMDYVSAGVCVNAVCAGPMARRDRTGDEEEQAVHTAKQLIGVVPMGRLIEAEELASAVTWLLSDGAAAVTGLVIPVDGGWGLCHH